MGLTETARKVFGINLDGAPTTAELVERAGFRHMPYSFETSDGYSLNLARIQEHDIEHGRPVAIIVHGLMSCSDFFVCQTPCPEFGQSGELTNKSLPFYLATRGYDVWLLNNRGSRYSMLHARHQIDSDAFWNFTWLEMARYDFPESLHFIKSITEQETFVICAFSQGTAQVLAAMSQQPALVSSIRVLLLFSPVIVPKTRDNTILNHIVKHTSLLHRMLGRRSLLWPVELVRSMTPAWLFSEICSTVAGAIFGWRMDHIAGHEKHAMYQNIASTTSVKVLIQWLEVVNAKSFVDAAAKKLEFIWSDHTEHDIAIYAVQGEDDTLADRELFHQWFSGKAVESLIVPQYEHIETIWGRDWGLKVRPFIEKACNEDLLKWKLTTRVK